MSSQLWPGFDPRTPTLALRISENAVFLQPLYSVTTIPWQFEVYHSQMISSLLKTAPQNTKAYQEKT